MQTRTRADGRPPSEAQASSRDGYRMRWLAVGAATALATSLAGVPAPADAVTDPQQEPCPSGVVALTFDDGPGPDTPEVLDVLAEHTVPATFFVLGENIVERPEYSQRADDEGHAIANHTHGHERLTELSDADIRATIDRADDAIRNAGIEPTTLLRPPYGATDDRVESQIEAAGYTQITWTVDPRDWEDRSAEQVRDHVLDNLHDGAVVLLHDWTTPQVSAQADASNTIEALPGIIEGTRDQGYCFGVLDDDGAIVPWVDDPGPPAAQTGLPALVGDGTWNLRDEHTSGPAEHTFRYGRSGDTPLMCDWNGDGDRTPGVVRDGEWFLRNDNSGGPADHVLRYGRADDTPICGDWDGDGVETVGVVRAGEWLLRNDNSGGRADEVIRYGRADDTPVVGDWDGDGQATIGVRRGNLWLLRDQLGGGHADHQFHFGTSDDLAVVGDWQAAGHDRPGVVRGDTWYLRHDLGGGTADVDFVFDAAGSDPLVWR